MKNQKFLTEKQLAALHSFVKSKYVEFYDVQIELVDHLASEIECVWEEDENVKFEVALDTVYKKFGIYGFSKIILKRQNAIPSLGRLLWWQEFQTFFKLPRLGITALTLVVICLIYSQTSLKIFIIVNSAFSLLMLVDELFKRRRYKPSGNYKLSAWQYRNSNTLFMNICLAPYLNMLITADIISVSWYLVLPMCIFLSWIAFFASSHAFKTQMKRQMEMYPEAFA